MIKEDLLYKDINNINKINSQNKFSAENRTLISKDEDKIPYILTIREKRSDNHINDNSANKTIPNTNDMKRKHLKPKISNTSYYSLNNNVNYYNKKKAINNNENSLKSFISLSR